MHKRALGLMLSGILATGAVGAVAMTPASATTSDNPVTSRLAGIKSALSGLVTDGTLTQAQADKVAGALESTLPERGFGGHHGRGGHFGGMGLHQGKEAAAKALGLTTEKLRAALQSGKSLADVAKDQKVSVDSLVKAIVTEAETKIAAAVKAGTITAERADKLKSTLTERVTEQVNKARPERGFGHGPRGAEWSPPSSQTPSQAPSETPGATLTIPSDTI